MKKHAPLLILLLLCCGALSCATSPTTDADLISYGEEPEGPGVFSGDSGEVSFSIGAGSDGSTADETTGAAAISADNAQEFTAFKRWLKSRQTQDDEYREFQQWLKYEQYKQWEKSAE